MPGHPDLQRGAVIAPIAAVVAVFAVTYLAALACLNWLIPPGNGSPMWWLATGSAVAIVVRCPRRWWVALVPAFALACFAASGSANSWTVAGTYGVVNILELTTACLLLTDRSRVGVRRWETIGDALRFVIAMAAALGVGAAIIALSMAVFPEDAGAYQLLDGYVITHALGGLAVAPLLLVGSRLVWGTVRQNVELAAVLIGAVFIGVWAFVQGDSGNRAFPVLLPVIWAAVRLEAWRATVVSLIMCAMAAYGTAAARGTFVGVADPRERIFMTQLLIATISLTTLVLILITRHRERLAAQTRDSERAMRIAIRDALVGMVTVRLDAGHVGEITEVNGTLCALLGYQPEQLMGRHCALFGADRDPAERAELDSRLKQLAGRDIDSYRQETTFYAADGTPLWVEIGCSAVHTSTAPPFALIHVHDLTDREQNKKLLEQMALHDPLTGVPNRTVLFQSLDTLLQQPTDQRGIVGLLYLDLDGFKHVNDTLGHAAGDEVLHEVARRLRTIIRPTDTVARLGGDEFAVVCASMKDPADLDRLAERVRASLTEPMALTDGHRAEIGVSIGVALADGVVDPDQLVTQADAAMYEAKRAAQSR